MGLLESTKRYRKTYENWISVLWAIHRSRSRIPLKFRNGSQIESPPHVAYLISRLLYLDSNINITKSVSMTFWSLC